MTKDLSPGGALRVPQWCQWAELCSGSYGTGWLDSALGPAAPVGGTVGPKAHAARWGSQLAQWLAVAGYTISCVLYL